jgi:hypothetical protein
METVAKMFAGHDRNHFQQIERILASRAAPRSVPHFLKPLGQAINISLNLYQFDINFLC